MHKLLLSLLAAFLIFSGCTNSSTTAEKEGKKKEGHSSQKGDLDITADQITGKMDLVCEMTSPITDTLTYQGKLYGFCSPGCKDEFKGNPDQYLAKVKE